MAHFLVQAGNDIGKIFALVEGDTSLGRSSNNDIVLNDAPTSRHHARITFRDDVFHVADLGSTHGVLINDKQIAEETNLQDGDIVRIGTTDLLFRTGKRTGDNPALTLSDHERSCIAFSVPIAEDSGTRAFSHQHLDILSRVAEATRSVFDLCELLGSLMDLIFEVFNPERGVILLYDEETGDLRPQVTRPEQEEIRISQTIVSHAIENRMSLLIADIAGDTRFSAAQSIVAESILAAICCPLVCKDNVLGFLYIDTQSHLLSYNKDDLAMLNIVASNAAIAIENAMLIEQKVRTERLAAIGVTVAGISHYVKNILSGMMGSSQLIERALEKGDSEIVAKFWPILQRSTDKISSLVQDMLSYSKKHEPEWQPGNLNVLVREIHENQVDRAKTMGVELHLTIEETLPDSHYDHRSIYDAILNIVGNAIEACEKRPGAQVTIATAWCGKSQCASLVVQDNGPGIPLELRKKILEPFFSTKGSKGTGLGLAVARKIVEEEHGGKLLIESEPEQGSTFTISLPLTPNIIKS